MPKPPIAGNVWVIAPDGTHAHTTNDKWEVIGHKSFGFTLYHNDGPAGSQSLWSEVKDGFASLEAALDYADKHPKAGTVKVRFTRNEITWLTCLTGMASDPATGIVGTTSGGGYTREAAREVFALLTSTHAKLLDIEP